MNNQNKMFWNNYYKTTNHDILEPSSFSNFVYKTYIEKYNNDNVYLKIADLGCGNSRDTKFFNSKKNLCYGIDINGVLDKENINCKLIKKDVLDVLKNYELCMLFDIIYMRWFLHALPYNISNDIFINSIHNLKPGGLITIELRSINDNELKKNSVYNETDKSFTTTHKRWLYSIDMLKDLASNNDCDVLYCEEGYFSPNNNTETNNPLLIRFICQKRKLAYYEKSENYSKYKHIIPKMSYSTAHYNEMSKLNKILEKNNIKYVAVAGTSLGLNRHGGIIPWDNDIDIGFVEKEWEKLFKIKDELEKEGFKYNTNGNNHCHFGPIDCFKLIKNNKNFYAGDAETFCSVDEYNNVVKQIFGYTYIYAPFNNHESLKERYGENYFKIGNVNDNFHFEDNTVKNFNLNHNDLSYQLK
jgi:hypothetical protein